MSNPICRSKSFIFELHRRKVRKNEIELFYDLIRVPLATVSFNMFIWLVSSSESDSTRAETSVIGKYGPQKHKSIFDVIFCYSSDRGVHNPFKDPPGVGSRQALACLSLA